MYREIYEMPRCANCGKLISWNPDVFVSHGRSLYTCSSKCAEVYERYKYPRYKKAIDTMESEGRFGLREGYVPG
jgi:ribosomal protein L24E